ncbi:MAG TPA: hypothetical protein VGK67_35440 [Myxococcales bacterium]|jgi:hypothetical protein
MPTSGQKQRVKTERIVDHLVAAGLEALPEAPELARRCLMDLSVIGGDRAVFATCVLTLELALLKDPEARAALPNYVAVLLEAYRDPRLANVLVAGSPELDQRWQRIRPVVADFVALRQDPPPAEEEVEEISADRVEEEEEPPASDQDLEARRAMQRLATPTELIAEIQEIIEDEAEPPPRRPPPPPPPPQALEVASGAEAPRRQAPPPPEDDEQDDGPDAETKQFWSYAEKALGRMPDPNQSLVGAQSFATARSSDRAHLMRFAHDLVARHPQVRQSRALAALTLLYVAGQEKERGLLGINKERLKLIKSGLSMLGDARAAGQVAVLFEADGPETRKAFAPLVDIVFNYLGFCAREKLDPRSADAASRFVAR